MKFDKGLMAGSSTMLILSLLEGSDMYGYQMIEELARRSNDAFQMKEGTLYPILHGLEKNGCLTAYQQEAPTGRVRKYYHITKKGKSLLDEKRTEWDAFRQGVTRCCPAGPTPWVWPEVRPWSTKSPCTSGSWCCPWRCPTGLFSFRREVPSWIDLNLQYMNGSPPQ